MSKFFLLSLLYTQLGLASCSGPWSSWFSKSHPVKAETTKITYTAYSNSGMAIHTDVQLFPDHLVWEYREMRTDCHLTDTFRYDRADYDALVARLSAISFSARDVDDYSSGGDGYAFAFDDQSGTYFHFDDSYSLAGDHEEVSRLILSFIEEHRTECEVLFKRLSGMPHERSLYGEFETLPTELLKYQKSKQ